MSFGEMCHYSAFIQAFQCMHMFMHIAYPKAFIVKIIYHCVSNFLQPDIKREDRIVKKTKTAVKKSDV